MNEAIKILSQKQEIYQQMIDANIGSGEQSALLKEELKLRLSEVAAAIKLLEQSRQPEQPQGFKPCGEGDNICNCKSVSECGYLENLRAVQKDRERIFNEKQNQAETIRLQRSALELAETELKALYKRLGFKGSKVLDAVQKAID